MIGVVATVLLCLQRQENIMATSYANTLTSSFDGRSIRWLCGKVYLCVLGPTANMHFQEGSMCVDIKLHYCKHTFGHY